MRILRRRQTTLAIVPLLGLAMAGPAGCLDDITLNDIIIKNNVNTDKVPPIGGSNPGGSVDGGGTTGGGHGSNHGEAPERLLIGEAAAAKTYVFDTESKTVVGSFDLTVAAPTDGGVAPLGAPSVYTGALGWFGYAVQADNNKAWIINGNLIETDAGDHKDYSWGTPSLVPTTVTGLKPIHFVDHDTSSTIFFDDDGVAKVVDENQLPGTVAITSFNSGMPHHGVGLAFAGKVLVSVPEVPAGGGRASPVGVRVFERNGTATSQQFLGCPSLHGEFSTETMVAFGCLDGVLIVKNHNGTLSSNKISNPSNTVDASVPPRVSTVVGAHEVTYFIGNYGNDQLARIDPSGSGSITPFENPPSGRLQFLMNHHGTILIVLTRDGRLHFLNPQTGVSLGSVQAVAAVAADAGAADIPLFAVGADLAYVSNPSGGSIVAIDIATRTVVWTHNLGMNPKRIAVLHGPHGG